MTTCLYRHLLSFPLVGYLGLRNKYGVAHFSKNILMEEFLYLFIHNIMYTDWYGLYSLYKFKTNWRT